MMIQIILRFAPKVAKAAVVFIIAIITLRWWSVVALCLSNAERLWEPCLQIAQLYFAPSANAEKSCCAAPYSFMFFSIRLFSFSLNFCFWYWRAQFRLSILNPGSNSYRSRRRWFILQRTPGLFSHSRNCSRFFSFAPGSFILFRNRCSSFSLPSSDKRHFGRCRIACLTSPSQFCSCALFWASRSSRRWRWRPRYSSCL